MTSFMFRRDLLDIIIPQSTEKLRICADYYLAHFGHLLTGTLTVGRALSCFRLHRTNSFSYLPRLGGPSYTGNFTQKAAIERLVVEHIAENIELFIKVLGWPYCRAIVSRWIPRRRIERFTRDHPKLRREYVGRSPLRFWVKYGLFYRLMRRK